MIWDIFYTSFGLYLAADLIGYKNFSRLIEQTQKRIQCVLNSETLEINKPHNFNDLDIEGNMMMIPLQGKVAIVTGAGRGIGAATAKILASRGANVIVNFVKDGESAKKVVAPIETSDNANDTNNNNNNNNGGRGKAFAKSRCLILVQDVKILILAILAIGILLSVIFIASPVAHTWAQNQHQMITNNNNTTSMMERGNIAMGFNQNKIIHNFKSTPTGGEIIITALDNNNDTETIKQIRNHTLDIQKEFSEGNFTKPLFIHAQQVPGSKVMSEKKDLIKYSILQMKNGST
jgi:hypothetical protein